MGIDEHRAARRCRNEGVVKNLREDTLSEDLHMMTVEDAKLGRMTMPRKLKQSDIDEYSLSPRFILEQGVRANGKKKLRTIDDLTKSLVNSCTWQQLQMECDTLDDFEHVLKLLWHCFNGSRTHEASLPLVLPLAPPPGACASFVPARRY